ncbi:MAG: type II secretion system F family protein [Candidatus Micrarchaeota archaeon]
MPPKTRKAKEQRPESLYVRRGEEIEDEAVEKATAEPLFVKITRYFGAKNAAYGKGAKFTTEQHALFEFLQWNISAEEFYAASKALLLYGVTLGAVLAAVFFLFIGPGLTSDLSMLSLGALLCVFVPLIGAVYFQQYPKMAANHERMMSLAYTPEIVNYLVMSLRLNPNLERAVEFAANHGRGKIADELKELVWDVQIGNFHSVEEGLDAMAYRWGGYSDDFKHALMLIRSSSLETDTTRRVELLEKASADVLEGSREKMDIYARNLHQPTVFLYYFGILLPLMLAIILPIAAAFVKNIPIAKAEAIFAIYCVLIPGGIWIYGGSILGGRPPTYIPPQISERYPGLPKRGNMRIAGIQFSYTLAAIAVFALTLFAAMTADSMNAASIPFYNRDAALASIPHVVIKEIGVTLYSFGILGSILAISFGISVYLYGKYGERKKVQDEIREMEAEFKDATYVLASRLGENRPLEDALAYSIEFLPKSKIGERVFKRVLENITLLGMTLEAASFDRAYGAMRNLPSQSIRSGMRLTIDSVELGVNVAAKSLMSLSFQMRNAQKIDETLKRLLSDITTLLSTMAMFVVPVVIAVVSSLQTIIINSLSGVSVGDVTEGTGASSANIPGMSSGGLNSILNTSGLKESAASPGEFLLFMGIYVVEVVILLTYFNAQVEDTNNKLHTYMSISKVLPIAALVFAAAAYFATSSLVASGA